MRIVILSLLRIGDTLMHLQIVRGLKRKYPGAIIELVINDEFSHLLSYLSTEVDKVHFFPRARGQGLIRSRANHLEEPVWMLEDWLQGLQGSQIDLLVNLTHTRISGFLMGLLPASSKVGLVIGAENGIQLLGNEWLRYLNEKFASGFQSEFHTIEVLARICEIEVPRRAIELRYSRQILLQPLTSDPKKNWHLSNWRSLLTKLRLALPDFPVAILASPQEFSQLHGLFQEEDLLVLSIQEAADTLRSAGLLISGDTSLVHLAALSQTRTLMISLGSSDPVKTGPYLEGAMVISGRAQCRPCDHNKSCSQPTHLCGQTVTVDQVISLVSSLFKANTVNKLNVVNESCTANQVNQIDQVNQQGGSDSYGQETRKSSRGSPQETRIGL
jgi:ADP-heptose:LPS heptosyltransferase